MSCVQEQIAELQRRIENLRPQVILELKVKLADARNDVVELERRIAEMSGSTEPAKAAIEPRKARVSVAADYRRSHQQHDVQLPASAQHVVLSPPKRGNQDQSQREESRKQAARQESERLPVGKVSRIISITRKVGESINIGDAIAVRLTRNEGEVVRLSLDAPKEILIYRGELYRQIQNQSEADSRFHPSASANR